MLKRFTEYGCSRRGMTLVELLLVMTVLSIVMLAVMSLYIPAHQSTLAQTQVSDVQDNLRLALKVMTRDVLLAGFLVPVDPIIDNDATGFTIRTRIVGNDFARVTATAPDTGKIRITVSDSDMVDNFKVGSRVRLFEAINANEVTEQPVVVGVTDQDRAYPVVDTDVGNNYIFIGTTNNPTLAAADILPETVMLAIRDETQPPLQTIRYQINNDSLERIVNGDLQALARNIDMATSLFDYWPNTGDPIKRIDVTLAGKTVAIKNEAISEEKIRSVETSVKMRNAF